MAISHLQVQCDQKSYTRMHRETNIHRQLDTDRHDGGVCECTATIGGETAPKNKAHEY